MGKQIVINIYKDRVTTYPDGVARAVSADAVVIGYDNNVYLEIYPVDRCAGEVLTPQTFLKIKDGGVFLWTDETINSWSEKVTGMGCCPVDSVGGFTYTGGDEIPAGNTITLPELHNVTIATISKGGVVLYRVPYTNGATTGTLDLTAFGGLSAGETIQVAFYKTE